MRHTDKQSVPEDISRLNTGLLRAANHHYPYFAPNDRIRLMIAGCEYAFKKINEADEKDYGLLMQLDRRIKELEPFTRKPSLSNTPQGQIQCFEMIQHFREGMQYLLSHFAVTHAWNTDQCCPWEDRVRMKAANYLETHNGHVEAGNAYYDFISEHRIIPAVQTDFIDIRDRTIELLRELPPLWHTLD